MKPVLLSADAEISAYMVPDEVAEDLIAHCEEFLDWNTKESFTEVLGEFFADSYLDFKLTIVR